MNRDEPPITLEVRVDARPRVGLLRAAIAGRLAGRQVVAGPEDAVGAAVARAVDEAQARKRRWR
jgi:hypothetical protein